MLSNLSNNNAGNQTKSIVEKKHYEDIEKRLDELQDEIDSNTESINQNAQYISGLDERVGVVEDNSTFPTLNTDTINPATGDNVEITSDLDVDGKVEANSIETDSLLVNGVDFTTVKDNAAQAKSIAENAENKADEAYDLADALSDELADYKADNEQSITTATLNANSADIDSIASRTINTNDFETTNAEIDDLYVDRIHATGELALPTVGQSYYTITVPAGTIASFAGSYITENDEIEYFYFTVTDGDVIYHQAALEVIKDISFDRETGNTKVRVKSTGAVTYISSSMNVADPTIEDGGSDYEDFSFIPQKLGGQIIRGYNDTTTETFIAGVLNAYAITADEIHYERTVVDDLIVNADIELPKEWNQGGVISRSSGTKGQYISIQTKDGVDKPTWTDPVNNPIGSLGYSDKLIDEATMAAYKGISETRQTRTINVVDEASLNQLSAYLWTKNNDYWQPYEKTRVTIGDHTLWIDTTESNQGIRFYDGMVIADGTWDDSPVEEANTPPVNIVIYDAPTELSYPITNLGDKTTVHGEIAATCFKGNVLGNVTGNADTATNATCFNNKTYAEAKEDILSGTANNATCFDGCTYADAKADILTGTAAQAHCVDIDSLTTNSYPLVMESATCELGKSGTCSITFAPSTGTLETNHVSTSCIENSGTIQSCNFCATNDVNIDGDAYITGDLTVLGTTTTTHSEEIVTPSENIFLRDTATTPVASGCYSGFTVKNYDGNNHDLEVGANSDGTLHVGVVGGTMEPVATRATEACMENNYVAHWDSTGTDLVTKGASCTHNLCVNGNATVTGTLTANLTGNADTATNATCFNGCTYTEACADILSGNAASATTADNATCFDGCTYACAKADILSGNAASATSARKLVDSNGCNRLCAEDVYIFSSKTVLGHCTGQNAFSSTFIGGYAAQNSTAESVLNTAVGLCSMRCLTCGKWNTAIGSSALYSITDGLGNTAVGGDSLLRNGACCYNTAVGNKSLSTIVGNNNTAIGYYAGSGVTAGTGNVFLGNCATGETATVDYAIAIGNIKACSLHAVIGSSSKCCLDYDMCTGTLSGVVCMSGNAASATNAACATQSCKIDTTNANNNTNYTMPLVASNELYTSNGKTLTYNPSTGLMKVNGVETAGYKTTIDSPNNVEKYSLIKIESTNKERSVPLCVHVYCNDYTISHYDNCNCCIQVFGSGTYGLKGAAGLMCDDGNSYYWLKISNYRSFILSSICPISVVCTVKTAPEEIEFTAPSVIACTSSTVANAICLNGHDASYYLNTSSTNQTKAGNLYIGAPSGCTETSAGGNGVVVNCVGRIGLYASQPSINFNYNNSNSTYSSRLMANDKGRFVAIVTDAEGCCAETTRATYCFCSDGTFSGASTICASTNIYSAGCPVITTCGGQTINGNLTIPTACGSFCGNLCGSAKSLCSVPSTVSTSCDVTITVGCCSATSPIESTWRFCGSNARLYSPGTIIVGGDQSMVAAVEYGAFQRGNIELSSASPFIDFHYNCYCLDYSSRLINNAQGSVQLIVNNGIGTTMASQSNNYCFCSNGTFGGTCSIVYKTSDIVIKNCENKVWTLCCDGHIYFEDSLVI